ncbi:hypothetical protein D3C75_603640 [compost metagenome]
MAPTLGAGSKASGMADNNNSGRVNEPRQNGDRTPHLGGGLGRAHFFAGPAQHPGTACPAVSRHRSSSPQHLGGLALGLAPGDGVGDNRPHRAGDAGGTGAQEPHQQQLPRLHRDRHGVCPRHRHAAGPARRHLAPEPGLRPAGQHRRSLRQQLQQQRHPDLLLHPAVAWRQGGDRRSPGADRGEGQAGA